MKINKELLPIKLHYFARYAGTAALAMLLPLLVREKGISTGVVGLLWMVMPVIGLFINTLAGTLADHFKAHRIVFLLSLLFLTVGCVGIVWIPDIDINTITMDSFRVTSLDETGQVNTTTNNSHLHQHLQLELTDPDMTVGEGHLALMVVDDTQVDGTWANGTWANGTQTDGIEAHGTPADDTQAILSDLPLSAYLKCPQFWLVFFALMLQQMGISTCVMISDAVCFQILGVARHKYGQQRLWGTVGMGVMGIVGGALIDAVSVGQEQKNYQPAVIICIVFMTLDMLLVSRMNIPSPHDKKLNLGQVGNVIRHPQVLLFLITVYVVGTSLGIVWVFKLMMVEDVALNWDPNMPTLKLLQGLIIGIETFGGELPFFFVSGMIIQKFGHTRVMSMAVLAVAVRCCLYYAVSNPWYFLPIELLNGLSYGLFHATMASYASLIAPPGAQATLQSIVRACFASGLSTAGVLGGVMYEGLGGSMVYLVVGISNFVYAIIISISHLLITEFCSHKKEPGYMVPTSSSSTSDTSYTDTQNQTEPTKEPLMEPA